MPTERLQPREEQDQHLDQTNRDASPNKNRVRDHCILQYQRYDNLQQEVWQQREGKALAEWKDPFNKVAIGEDGKPMEKQIILPERYARLAGGVTGILETFGAAAASWAVKKSLDTLCGFAKNMIMGKKESVEDKLDRLFMSHYQIGLDHLENATMTHDDQWRKDSIREAANEFMRAAGRIETGCFVKAKSMLSVAGCYHWVHEYDAAKLWLKKAYEEGLAECNRSHPRNELAQFKEEFINPLEKLLKSYSTTSGSTVPLLTQFSRLDSGSSSSTSDRDQERIIQDLKRQLAGIQRQDTSDRSLLRNPERLTLIRTLEGHQNGVRALMMHNGRIISGSADNTIKVWNPTTGECLNTLKGHENSVCALSMHNGHIISGSWDNTIKVWNPTTGECLNTLKGHWNSVDALSMHNGHIISGSWDNTIKVWNPTTGECLNTLKGHGDSVRALSMHNGHIISGSADNTIKVWGER